MSKNNIEKEKPIFAKVVITVVFAILFTLNTITKSIQIDSTGLILIILAVLPWLQSILKSIELPGFKAIFKEKEMYEATRVVEFKNTMNEAEVSEISWNSNLSIARDAHNFKKSLISFKGRINYDHEAGSNYLMRINVNGIYLTESYVINKENILIKGDGRQFLWYSKDYDSWSLCFSPDFISNYNNHKYKILNGDPYLFVFDISNIKPVENKMNVVIEHNGREDSPAFRNSIIISEFNIY